MKMKDIFHMNAGDGETSYANNSLLQKAVISKTWGVLDKSLKDMFSEKNNGFPECMRIADFGCSSGPNTIFLVSHITDTIHDLCVNNNVKNNIPEFEVFLNDLPHNDFNNLFKLVSDFSRKNRKDETKLECRMYGAPGSFYGRLFKSNTIHFAYSSYSLHWLSQIPEGLGMNNKENIYIATNSPPQVIEAYARQFQRDFSMFLSVRAEEITSGGRMVLAFIGRCAVDASRDEFGILTILAETLSDMVIEGLVNKDDLYSFNFPMYTPCLQEVKAIINDEGSFNLDNVEIVRVPWDAHEDYDDEVFDKDRSGKLVANCVRAFGEPLLASHFGSSIIDGVFDRYAKKMAEHLSKERSSYYTLAFKPTRTKLGPTSIKTETLPTWSPNIQPSSLHPSSTLSWICYSALSFFSELRASDDPRLASYTRFIE